MRQATLFFVDIGLLYASLVATLDFRYGRDFANQYYLHLVPFIIIFALWLLIFFIANLYDPRTFRNTPEFYSNLIRTIAIASIISIAFFYLIPIFGITPKTNLLIFIIIFTALESLGRSLFNSVVETKFKKMALIVGANGQAKELADFVTKNPQLGYEIKDLLSPDKVEQINHTITNQHIDTIVISPEAYQVPEIIDTFYKALAHRITFFNLSTFYERLTGRVPLGAINQIWFLENLSEGSKRAYEGVKRIGDIVFGLSFGIVSLVLYPFIAAAIFTSSPGPLFYRQIRIGRMGRSFQMIKFRTMIPNAEAKTGAVWAMENDHRITTVGNFLRKTRLDEIPQFWNIIKGDMSLVGPRAERPEFHDNLKKEVPFYEERYLIKPGLTGWAQINYRYGASVQDAAEKLQYDLYYIKHRSPVLDVGIILKTIRISLQQAGK